MAERKITFDVSIKAPDAKRGLSSGAVMGYIGDGATPEDTTATGMRYAGFPERDFHTMRGESPTSNGPAFQYTHEHPLLAAAIIAVNGLLSGAVVYSKHEQKSREAKLTSDAVVFKRFAQDEKKEKEDTAKDETDKKQKFAIELQREIERLNKTFNETFAEFKRRYPNFKPPTQAQLANEAKEKKANEAREEKAKKNVVPVYVPTGQSTLLENYSGIRIELKKPKKEGDPYTQFTVTMIATKEPHQKSGKEFAVTTIDLIGDAVTFSAITYWIMWGMAAIITGELKTGVAGMPRGLDYALSGATGLSITALKARNFYLNKEEMERKDFNRFMRVSQRKQEREDFIYERGPGSTELVSLLKNPGDDNSSAEKLALAKEDEAKIARLTRNKEKQTCVSGVTAFTSSFGNGQYADWLITDFMVDILHFDSESAGFILFNNIFALGIFLNAIIQTAREVMSALTQQHNDIEDVALGKNGNAEVHDVKALEERDAQLKQACKDHGIDLKHTPTPTLNNEAEHFNNAVKPHKPDSWVRRIGKGIGWASNWGTAGSFLYRCFFMTKTVAVLPWIGGGMLVLSNPLTAGIGLAILIGYGGVKWWLYRKKRNDEKVRLHVVVQSQRIHGLREGIDMTTKLLARRGIVVPVAAPTTRPALPASDANAAGRISRAPSQSRDVSASQALPSQTVVVSAGSAAVSNDPPPQTDMRDRVASQSSRGACR